MVERAGRTPRRTAAFAAGASPSPAGRAKRVMSPRGASPRGASPRGRASAPAASPPAPAPAAKHGPHYEFGGPLGAAGICLGLPGVCYFLVRVCNQGGCLAPSALPELPPAPRGAYVSAQGFAAYLAWIALCVALHVLLPGERKQGVVLRDGTRLNYKLNGAQLQVLCGCARLNRFCGLFGRVLGVQSAITSGFEAYLATLRAGMRVFFVIAALAAGLTYAGVLDLSWVHDNFLVRPPAKPNAYVLCSTALTPACACSRC